MKRVGFVCEYGSEVGWGHLMRCVALAQAFRRRGWETLLASPSSLSRDLPSEAVEAFSGRVALSLELPIAPPEALASCAAIHIDDMYRGDDWFAAFSNAVEDVRGAGRPLLTASDDLGRRTLASVDVAVNSELGRGRLAGGRGYAARRRRLLGERYALVRSGFGQPAPPKAACPAGALPVFVMLGGTDVKRLLETVLETLAATGDRRIAPVVAAGAERGRERLEGLLSERFAWWYLLRGLGSAALAGWMDFARMAVIGCGGSVYELACRRRPFLGLCLADNQAAAARQIEERWGLPTLDARTGFDAGAFCGAWERLLAAVEERSLQGPQGVDANGTNRVAEIVETLSEGG